MSASNFSILRHRIEAAGVAFANRPSRLHHQRHGDLQDTFLVWENERPRTPLDTFVDWTFSDGDGYRLCLGVEAAISRRMVTSLYRFVRGALYLFKDDNSAYGTMLMISDTPPDPWHKFDLLASLPSLSCDDDAKLLTDSNAWYSQAQLDEIDGAMRSGCGRMAA